MSACMVVVPSHCVGVIWRLTWNAPAGRCLPEHADVQAQVRPEWFVVGFEDRPLGAAVERFLDPQVRASDGKILPLRRQPVVANHGAQAPDDIPGRQQGAKTVDAQKGFSSPFSASDRVTARAATPA